MNIYVINGPNINLLGTREPEIYGNETLETIAENCQKQASKAGHVVQFMQSNLKMQLMLLSSMLLHIHIHQLQYMMP